MPKLTQNVAKYFQNGQSFLTLCQRNEMSLNLVTLNITRALVEVNLIRSPSIYWIQIMLSVRFFTRSINMIYSTFIKVSIF